MNVSNKFKYVLFTDDTSILYSDKDIKNVQRTVNKELYKIHGWLCTNTLSINLTKTNFMVFSKSNKFVIPEVYINNHLVQLTDNVRFLGDNRMTWKKHINYVFNKLRTVSFLIYKASSILDDKSLKTLYISLFYPHIDYCCEVWGNTYTTHIQCLYLLQRK